MKVIIFIASSRKFLNGKFYNASTAQCHRRGSGLREPEVFPTIASAHSDVNTTKRQTASSCKIMKIS